MTNVEITIREVEKFNESIVDILSGKGINDTGEAARSIHVEYGSDFVNSVGIFYIEFLDTGRAPGKFPPLAPIERWVESKLGISFEDSDFDNIVYQVRKKIADFGTNIFLNNGEGLEIEQKVVSLREVLTEKLAENAALEVRQRLDKFKTAYIFSI